MFGTLLPPGKKALADATSVFWRQLFVTLSRDADSAFDFLGQKFAAESHEKP